ncbi:glycoside hydrolase family 28 protein [Bacillus sp. FJAT-50079]|uniref:glycoside hydrolase family 28 protein n=1 Tax=Bacillus sp. FJAT-50079 TaxID=2833577 RepID=UPI001BC9DE2C|nr:glycoside hydrolase family 28 protein [Bacillus sp. FJAT-50079]MBS4207849.1 glycoside hydrolase family 28 protein [Bacillus sp. FJAT-50079]
MYKYDITLFGAKADGVTDNTAVFAEAINECAKNGGGTVFIPAGTYFTGPIELMSNITLYLDAGALIKFTDDFDAYQPVKTRWSGYECYGYSPLIYGNNLKNVAIKGEGTFDGQGKAWWDVNAQLRLNSKAYTSETTKEIARLNAEYMEPIETNLVEWDSQFLRPALLQLIDCEHVTIDGVTLQNSPFWNTHLVYCNHVTVNNVSIINPSDTPNGDGLDIDSCSNVRVSNTHFDVGDDCLVLKSGINEDGRRVGKPTENVTVTNCTMLHGHGGFVLGSEMSGGMKNITVSNCVFIGTDRGIRIKTNRERGGYVKNVLVNNIYMEDVLCPIAINSFYRHGVNENDPTVNLQEAIPVTEKTPVVDHIQLRNITAKNCRAAAGFIYGLPEMPVSDISLSNITLEMTTDPAEVGGEPDMVREELVMAGAGIYGKYVEGLVLDRVRVETRQGPALIVEQSNDVEISHLSMKQVHEGTPVVELNQVENVYIAGRQAKQLADSYAKENEIVKNN